jgi:threonine/homoserine/homoserine lactone efflux protein
MTVVQVASLFVAVPTMYYAFFSVIEIAATAFIVWSAWKWVDSSSVRVHEGGKVTSELTGAASR